MIQAQALSSQTKTMLQLEDYGVLQTRYQSLPLAGRALAVLADAEGALTLAEVILGAIANSKGRHTLDAIRKNVFLTSKMRPSEAKNMLLDAENDFIDLTRRKLASWRKTLERLSEGEAIVRVGNKDMVSSEDPLAVSVAALGALGSYLSVIQLVFSEMAKSDPQNADLHQSHLVKIRRCATVLSDCDSASAISSSIH